MKRKDRILINVYSSFIRISLIALAVAVVMELAMLAYSAVNSELYGPYLLKYRIFYILMLTVAVTVIILNCYVKKDVPRRFRILNYVSPVYAVFLFGWALAVTYSDFFISNQIDATVFMTSSMIVPLSVFLFPSVYAAVVTAANAVMFYLILSTTGGAGQFINIFIFFIFQLVLGISFLRLNVKLAERIVAEQDNSIMDIMTGVFNRRAYEDDINGYLQKGVPGSLTYIGIDINGLKDMNDGCGHEAGDRLIIGVACCLNECFGEDGKVYRIGGDEFAAILEDEHRGADQLLTIFEKSMRDWSEHNGQKISASFGCVSASEFPEKNIVELARDVDERMYLKKALYYKENGSERHKNKLTD